MSARHSLHRAGESVSLSPKDYALLERFMERAGEVLERTRIVDQTRYFASHGDSHVIERT